MFGENGRNSKMTHYLKFCDLDKESGFRLLINFCVCRAGRVVLEGVALSGFLSRAAKFVYEEFNV